MDLNCGDVLEGTKTIQGLGAELFQLLLATASGQAAEATAFPEQLAEAGLKAWQVRQVYAAMPPVTPSTTVGV